MPERLYPGVYIEEKQAAPAPIQGVSTSNAAFVGFTLKGPTDTPTLVTSFPEFADRFGSFTSKSLVPLAVFAFFQNGGSRAFIVRTVASDGDVATTAITNAAADEDTGVNGDASVGPFALQCANTPVWPSTLTVEQRDPVTAEVIGTAVGDGATTVFETAGTANLSVPANLPIVPGSVTIKDAGLVAEDVTDDGNGRLFSATDGTTGTIDYTTGAIYLLYVVAPGTGTDNITIDYTNIAVSATDDGAGALTGTGVASGTVDYVTGEISITFSSSVDADNDFFLQYDYVLFDIDVQWPGLAGNDIRVTVQGATGFELDSTASYSRFTVLVSELDANGDYVVIETFEEVVFDDNTSGDYVATKVNDVNTGSDYITLTATGNDEKPADLLGTQVTGEIVIDISPAYDGVEVDFTYTMLNAVHPTTFELTLSTGEIVVDDGSGNLQLSALSGGTRTLDPNGTNTIVYDTGVASITWSAAPAAIDTATADYYAQAAEEAIDLDAAGGLDGSTITRSVVSSPALAADELGLFSLNQTDELMQLVIPDFETDPEVSGDMIDYAELRKDRFAILSVPEGLNPQEAVNYKKYDLNRNTSYAAIYYPHIQLTDPLTENTINMPPGGHVAGIYARTDNNRNVGKAPAGAQDGALRFLTGLERDLTPAQAGIVYPNRINPLISWPQVGLAVWGARTLEVGGDFGQINARRLFQFLEKSVFNATHGFVFENNGPPLWARIRFQIVSFLNNLFNQGYFAGNSPAEAFFVIVDSSNNPQSSIDAGLLYVDIGVAPTTPAEFIVFRFQRKISE